MKPQMTAQQKRLLATAQNTSLGPSIRARALRALKDSLSLAPPAPEPAMPATTSTPYKLQEPGAEWWQTPQWQQEKEKRAAEEKLFKNDGQRHEPEPAQESAEAAYFPDDSKGRALQAKRWKPAGWRVVTWGDEFDQ